MVTTALQNLITRVVRSEMLANGALGGVAHGVMVDKNSKNSSSTLPPSSVPPVSMSSPTPNQYALSSPTRNQPTLVPPVPMSRPTPNQHAPAPHTKPQKKRKRLKRRNRRGSRVATSVPKPTPEIVHAVPQERTQHHALTMRERTLADKLTTFSSSELHRVLDVHKTAHASLSASSSSSSVAKKWRVDVRVLAWPFFDSHLSLARSHLSSVAPVWTRACCCKYDQAPYSNRSHVWCHRSRAII